MALSKSRWLYVGKRFWFSFVLIHVCLSAMGAVSSPELQNVSGVGGAQVLEMDKSSGTAIDFKYAIIGTALGVAISAGFLALKIWMIRRHLSDNDSADLKNRPQDTILQKKRRPRDARVIEL